MQVEMQNEEDEAFYRYFQHTIEYVAQVRALFESDVALASFVPALAPLLKRERPETGVILSMTYGEE